jgi:hypothetical protein
LRILPEEVHDGCLAARGRVGDHWRWPRGS